MKKRKKFDYDCAVIGGGPGGLVAALYLCRFKRKVALIDSGHSRAQWIPHIRNLIGHQEKPTGQQLLERLRKQVMAYPCDWIQGEAKVKRSPPGFLIEIGRRKISARKVILATGMKDRQPPISNIPALRRLGLLAYCPICDGYEYSQRKIGVLIESTHGLKKADFLRQFSDQIFVFQTRAFPIPQRTLKKYKERQISIYLGDLDSIKYQISPRGLSIRMKNQRAVFTHVAYVALGVDFNRKATEDIPKLRKNSEGFIHTKSHQETSVPGLYAVGDCVNSLAQVSVAVGQAALAATRIHNELRKIQNLA